MTTNTAAEITAALLPEIQAMIERAVAAQLAVQPEAGSAPAAAPQPKADPKYRTQKQIDAGHSKADEIKAEVYAQYGVRRWADLPEAGRTEYKTRAAAAWKSLKGTRKTPVHK